MAAQYCAYLCKKFGFTEKNIVSHKEAHDQGYANNHGDPESWMKHFGDSMGAFRERVAKLLTEPEEPPVEPPEILYTAQLYGLTRAEADELTRQYPNAIVKQG